MFWWNCFRKYQIRSFLTFTSLCANSADDKFMICFLIFLRKQDLHEMSNPVFWEKLEKKNISKCRLLKILPRMLSVKNGTATNRMYLSIYINRCTTFSTKSHVHQAMTQISLRKCAGWSESLLRVRWLAKFQYFFSRTAAVLLRNYRCAGWSRFSLNAQAIENVVVWLI